MVKQFDNFLDAIQAILLSFLVKLGPFVVALMPALFTAYAIYKLFAPEAGRELALLFAVIVAIGIEAVGIISVHTAVDLYNGKVKGTITPGKYRLMVSLVPVYAIGVSLVVGFAHNSFGPLLTGLGVASPWFTVIVYIAVALARDLANIEQAEQSTSQRDIAREQDRLAHERAIERQRLQMEHQEKLKQMELRTQVQIEQSRATREPAPASTEPAPSQHKCDNCGRDDFSSIQAVNAHSRFCAGVRQTNGNGNGLEAIAK